jgi:hypothetical protein
LNGDLTMSDYACSEAKKESISARAGGASSEGPELFLPLTLSE